MGNSPPTASIHILDDDSLLNVFRLYRPFLLGEDEDETDRLSSGGRGNGPADAGGINLLTFAKDGESLYSGRHPT
jgi:hypothetical protein